MVSIKSLITLGLIGGGILAFYRLGGSSGIGSRIGGGFGSLFDGFTNALNPVKDVLDIIPNSNATGQGGQNYDNSGGNGGGSQQIPLDEYPTTDNQGNPLIPITPITNIDKSAFTIPLQQGIISKGFAEKYSFIAPPKSVSKRLDVSETFQYINSPTYRSAVSVGNTLSQFGGYTSADDQRNELQRQIEINATKYPEWFS